VFFEFLSLWLGFLVAYALYQKPRKWWLLPALFVFLYLLLGPFGPVGGAVALLLRYRRKN